MNIGVLLPPGGVGADPEVILNAAQAAEELGYDSLWVGERLLYPTAPRTPYPAAPDGVLPPYSKCVLTPLETLAFVAARTRRIALGTSVLTMPLHNPVMLARQIATLDVLSGGRLRLGLGQGWSRDEFAVVGGCPEQRAARADEFVAVLKAIWTTDPAEFAGRHFQLPRSILQPKPLQQPHPPIYLAGNARGALARAGRLADGWIAGGIPLANVGALLGQVREAACATGRDPVSVRLVMFAFPAIVERSLDNERSDFVGSLAEIARDVAVARDLGVAELILAFGFVAGEFDPGVYLRTLELLRTVI